LDDFALEALQNDNELRVLGERLIRYYQSGTRMLVERTIHELAERQRQSGG